VKVLFVEDKERLANFVKQGMVEQAYTVHCVSSCAAARQALGENVFDLIILDLGLPDGDGLDLLSEWRKNAFNAPVLILSARDTVEDRITGLDRGADDYLPKPFSLQELMARIRSLLRRQLPSKDSLLEHRSIKLDLLCHTVHLSGQRVDVTSREFALVELFLQNPGRVLPRTFICQRIWEEHYDVDTNLLDVYMSKLRAKFDTTPGQPLFKTVRGVGYAML